METANYADTCNWRKYKHECSHKYVYPPVYWAPTKEEYRPSVTPSKGVSMNTYTITASAMYEHTYTIESTCEEDAISEVEWGYVEPDDIEFIGELEDIKVVDFECGEIEYTGGLQVNFVVRDVKDASDSAVEDALWNILASSCGKTTSCGPDGELELVGFNVEQVWEA